MIFPPASDTTYLIGRWLHWIAAIFFIAILIGSDIAASWAADDSDKRELFDYWHIGFGIVFFYSLFLRIGWAIIYPETRTQFDSRWQAIAARMNHFLLYLLMILTPMSGLIGELAEGTEITLFGLFPWSVSEDILNLNEGIWADDVAYYCEEIHLFLKWAIYGILFLHVAGAMSHWLKHRFGLKLL